MDKEIEMKIEIEIGVERTVVSFSILNSKFSFHFHCSRSIWAAKMNVVFEHTLNNTQIAVRSGVASG